MSGVKLSATGIPMEGRFVLTWAMKVTGRGSKRRFGKNLPLALTPESLAHFEKLDEASYERGNPSAPGAIDVPVKTIFGETILLSRADCGAGCRCARSWRKA